jgi:hypothetical protein
MALQANDQAIAALMRNLDLNNLAFTFLFCFKKSKKAILLF